MVQQTEAGQRQALLVAWFLRLEITIPFMLQGIRHSGHPVADTVAGMVVACIIVMFNSCVEGWYYSSRFTLYRRLLLLYKTGAVSALVLSTGVLVRNCLSSVDCGYSVSGIIRSVAVVYTITLIMLLVWRSIAVALERIMRA